MTRLTLPEAAAALRRGELVVMPTETVYGLAGCADDPHAVAAIFHAKGRPSDDPLIVHVTPALLGEDPVAGLHALGLVDRTRLADGETTLRRLLPCWPGPLTLVLPRGPSAPDTITAGLPTVAVRMPAHPVAVALINTVGRPLVAPSANRFGRISPTTVEAAEAELGDRVSGFLDGGPCAIGLESTILRVRPDGSTQLLRPGRLDLDTLTALLDAAPDAPSAPTVGPQVAPGLLASHYAPRTPLLLLGHGEAPPWDALRARLGSGRLGWLSWSAPVSPPPVPAVVEILSPSGSLDEAAHRLFALLRSLDGSADLLLAELPPSSDGLGAALLDRLRRAAASTPPL